MLSLFWGLKPLDLILFPCMCYLKILNIIYMRPWIDKVFLKGRIHKLEKYPFQFIKRILYFY